MNSTHLNLSIFPPELIQLILTHLPIKDLMRTERVSKMLQAFCLAEIKRRIRCESDEWGVSIHLTQTMAKATAFDPKEKTVTYSIPMDPIHINTMFDHRRQIHCSLMRRVAMEPNYLMRDGFTLTVEKGMTEGKTVQLNIKGALCEVDAAITRLKSSAIQQIHDKKSPLSLAPTPLTYALQVTQMRLPLSTIAV
ncbi:uncharacterized protein BYT42DRAFT_591477 [Radiomyces spectabilis]|uniref:uncharacterized protein n=1 Tax=Radiomyces spectabilis TaxID=64574 RepID=UPI0022200A81|nr:uncharacterized protein BYT42DRAFT_591477 [Radiomyces spectabilis]KAI8393945.1 hypothetical protein BYT42DRAFT_591477 [Radiomyces spectabilis]